MKRTPSIFAALLLLASLACIGVVNRSASAQPGVTGPGKGMGMGAGTGADTGAASASGSASGTVAPTAPPPAVFRVDKSTIVVNFTANTFTLSRSKIVAWIQKSANGVARYFGEFPVSKLTINIAPVSGRSIKYAETFPRNGSEIKVLLGTDTTEDDLKTCWMLTHEMVHLGFPFTDDAQDWATEGLATYSESFIRAQIGEQTKEAAWADLKKSMAQGLPQAGDRGLNNTRTWGRVYWGGAIFYILADIQIRSQTHNKLGLPDALNGIVKSGGNIESQMSLDDTFAAGDKATGTKVLTTLYKQMGTNPIGADLDSLWKGLGITSQSDGTVTLDQSSPMARIRTAIESGRARER
jgi:hypothetical protein